MIFQVNGIVYRMSFSHHIYSRPAGIRLPAISSRPVKMIRGETCCYIAELPQIANQENLPEPIKRAEASTYCSVADQYKKETGRRLALRRALEKVWPEVEGDPVLTKDHHKIWGIAFNAYSNRFPDCKACGKKAGESHGFDCPEAQD
jgi:hypothetical protein